MKSHIGVFLTLGRVVCLGVRNTIYLFLCFPMHHSARGELLYATMDHVSNSRVDIHLDNLVLKGALHNGGCRKSAVNTVVKEILRYRR